MVQLCDGSPPEGIRLREPTAEGGLFLVVSDDCVLIKATMGGPEPGEEGEGGTGHWVAWIGQVPTRVKGRVKAGDWIGAAIDGGHVGEVVAVGSQRAVGIAIEGKEDEGEGKVLVAISFNQGSIGMSIREATEGLEGTLKAINVRVAQLETTAQGHEDRLDSLKEGQALQRANSAEHHDEEASHHAKLAELHWNRAEREREHARASRGGGSPRRAEKRGRADESDNRGGEKHQKQACPA